MKTALLLSGGIRSACIAWMLRPDIAISVQYGQPSARSELRSAAAICAELGTPLCVLSLTADPRFSDETTGSILSALSPYDEPWLLHADGLIFAAALEAARLGASRLVMASERPERMASAISSLERDGAVVKTPGGEEVTLVFPAAGRSSEDLVRDCRIPGQILVHTHNCFRSEAPCHDCLGCDSAALVYLSIGFDLGYL